MSVFLPPGLYEALVTRRLESALKALRERGRRDTIENLDKAEAPEVLARFVHDLLVPVLGSVTGDDRLERQLDIVNSLLSQVRTAEVRAVLEGNDDLAPPLRQLISIVDPQEYGLGEATAPERPAIPLSASNLLVNAPRDHKVGSEIKRELASADRVDLIVSFLKFNGLRLIKDSLRQFLERRPNALRVLTTTYMGATDRRVLDELVEMGAEVKVSYDTRRTRLHAKAWFFYRESGYSTAFIGSSNLSAPALMDGLEWNVRLSNIDNRCILNRFRGVFEQYWAEGEFESYNPDRDRERFDKATRAETHTAADALALHLDVRPYPFQEEILEHLQAERERGHTRNLVVAATGTGKTVVAALDFRRLRKQMDNPTLLFVAHRKEILDQSLATFRVVLRDGIFGEKLYGGRLPEGGRYVFASIQSFRNDRLERIDPDYYDVIIIDEFHHAAAKTYDSLLRHFQPKFLLGLTATPERTDGQSILHWFDDRLASELRLWHALDQQLLCPFHYFAVADDTDLRKVPWSAGRYVVADLEKVYTGDHARIRKVLRALHKIVSDPGEMRALGFCVSIDHAEFMAGQFNEAGIRAEAVTSRTEMDTRDATLRRLRDREINIIFSVDIFNEGVDLPEVDTVLFLRPTESATVFLQQLGRGLRLSDGKDCLTALDFVGNMHSKFRFDRRFQAIVGGTRKDVQRQIEQGFPTLPPGCAIHLERHAQELILDNIRRALGAGWPALVEDLRGIGGPITLETFLRKADVDLFDLYAGADKGWTRLRRDAGHELSTLGPNETQFARALSRLLHVNDALRFEAWNTVLKTGEVPEVFDLNLASHRLMLMLSTSLESTRLPVADHPEQLLRTFLAHEPLRGELWDLLKLLADQTRRPTRRLGPGFDPPLSLHGDYSLSEIMAAFAVISPTSGKLVRPQAGVFRHKPLRTDLFFVTLQKSEKDYSPTTMYNDFPISSTLFHWQSQSNTRADSDTGRRYQNHKAEGNHILLFVRKTKSDSRGQTGAYTFLGPATYISHEGERPMSITWKLNHPMPAELFDEMKIAAG